jgi:hypothetical protein
MEPEGSLLHSQDPLMVPILSQTNQVHTTPPSYVCVHVWSPSRFKSEADVSHLVSVPSGLPGPLYRDVLKQSWKAVVMEHPLVLDHFG